MKLVNFKENSQPQLLLVYVDDWNDMYEKWLEASQLVNLRRNLRRKLGRSRLPEPSHQRAPWTVGLHINVTYPVTKGLQETKKHKNTATITVSAGSTPCASGLVIPQSSSLPYYHFHLFLAEGYAILINRPDSCTEQLCVISLIIDLLQRSLRQFL